MSNSGPRYAIYFAPNPSSPLWCFGCSVLGYDAATALEVGFATMLEDNCPEWRELTQDPRRYGFHGTLKAPFHLHPDASEAALLDAVTAFAANEPCVHLAGLEVAGLSRFVALVPVGESTALQALASQVVTAFDFARAPLTAADRERRNKASLTERQAHYLETHGYPYVHEDFRFHMTLSGPLDKDLIDDVQIGLSQLYAMEVPAGPVTIDTLAVFKQDTSDSRFRIIARAPLA